TGPVVECRPIAEVIGGERLVLSRSSSFFFSGSFRFSFLSPSSPRFFPPSSAAPASLPPPLVLLQKRLGAGPPDGWLLSRAIPRPKPIGRATRPRCSPRRCSA